MVWVNCMVFLKPCGLPRLNDPKFTTRFTHRLLLCIICIHFVLISIAELLGVMKYLQLTFIKLTVNGVCQNISLELHEA